ncbi:unnamed protein product [Orchesella dallaii]|uniref:Uncharacterized protein n=1 Tax=Orchesella dallaii TaxID=48710 RepID=A0ABP1PVR8_9HEXA
MMEEWKQEIIKKNLDKLITLTICKAKFLTKLEVLGILGDDDVEELEVMAASRIDQARKFYKIILTRVNALESLLEALRETSQSGAIDLLTTEMTNQKLIGLENFGSIVYDKNRELGRGSNGTIVFKGSFGNRPAAVKRIHSEMVTQKTIIKETKHLICCDQHENIIRYFSTKVVQQHVLIALELCDMSLKDWVTNKAIDISPVEILRQTTVGLEWLHEHRIIHRDIKPENILLSAEIKKVKISDFGLSIRILEERCSVSTQGAAGTQGWIAPEVLQSIQLAEGDEGKKLTFTYASDIFSLGCLYYYVLTNGNHAFGDSVRRNANILDGKHSITYEKISSVCIENTVFIKFMVLTNPLQRPSCKTVLACPLFWVSDRRQQFLEDVAKQIQTNELLDVVFRPIKNYSRYCSDCRLDHDLELGNSKKYPGCVIPFVYLEFQKVEGLREKYYSSSSGMNTANSVEPYNGYIYRLKDEIVSMVSKILVTEDFDTAQKVIRDIEKFKTITDYTEVLHNLVGYGDKSLPSDFMKKVELLIDKNADPDVDVLEYCADVDGYVRISTFLHRATSKIQIPLLFNELLEYLVSINKTRTFIICDTYKWFGKTVLHYAVENFEPLDRSLDILESIGNGNDIFNIGGSMTNLIESAIQGGRSESFLKKLIKRGAKWDCNTFHGNTLHFSATYLNLPALKLFISLGVDVNKKNIFGSTALHEAVSGYDKYPQLVDKIVEELVANGADVNIRNKDGDLPSDIRDGKRTRIRV